mmetsp:Transcript_34249/g.24746  ORF Transcript_34249/g.24746 Transcript_34249/m.24746 type:complete len:101 (-) Transcript_34249:159-461(-)
MDKLKVTRGLLAEQHGKLNSAQVSVQATTDNFKSTSEKHSQYGDKINRSGKLITEIQAKEAWDEFKLKGSFYLFLASAAYLFLKRFYLNEIISLLFWMVI